MACLGSTATQSVSARGTKARGCWVPEWGHNQPGKPSGLLCLYLLGRGISWKRGSTKTGDSNWPTDLLGPLMELCLNRVNRLRVSSRGQLWAHRTRTHSLLISLLEAGLNFAFQNQAAVWTMENKDPLDEESSALPRGPQGCPGNEGSQSCHCPGSCGHFSQS